MKLKKKTSMMLLAASTAAIAGIAAVSFAAWQGGNFDTLNANAQTGYLKTFGFTEQTETKELGDFVPYNQGTIEGSSYKGVTFVSVELPEYYVEAGQEYTITVQSNTELSFYVKVGDEVTEAPENLSGWTKIDKDEAVVAITDTGAGEIVSGKYISFVLDSENLADQNESGITFEVKLVEVNA